MARFDKDYQQSEVEQVAIGGSVSYSNIAKGNIDISTGDFVGRDEVTLDEMHTKEDLVRQLQKLLALFIANQDEFNDMDAEEIEEGLIRAQKMLYTKEPSKKRVMRSLKNVSMVLGESDSPGVDPMMAELDSTIELADEVLA